LFNTDVLDLLHIHTRTNTLTRYGLTVGYVASIANAEMKC